MFATMLRNIVATMVCQCCDTFFENIAMLQQCCATLLQKKFVNVATHVFENIAMLQQCCAKCCKMFVNVATHFSKTLQIHSL